MSTPIRPSRRPGVLLQSTPEATLLLAPDSGMYYELNDVGARVWDLCDGSLTIEELVEMVCAEFDAPAAVVAGDVQDLLAELTKENLVEDAA